MRLIDADVLGIGLCNPDIFMDRAYAAGWNGVVRLLQSAPTITPESLVRHGRWETSSDPEEIIKDFACSICDEVLCDFDTEVCWPGQNCYFFCPNCGALMREDKPC